MKANGTRDTNRFFTPLHYQDDISRNFNPRPPPGFPELRAPAVNDRLLVPSFAYLSMSR